MSLAVMKGVAFTEKRLLQWLKEDGKVVVQTKRDEIRCTVVVDYDGTVTYTSAQGKPLFNLQCFDSLWKMVSEVSGIYKFDTGVCVNDSFDLTKRTVRAATKGYVLNGRKHHIITEKLPKQPVRTVYEGLLVAAFWLYDLPTLQGDEWDYQSRRIEMAEIVRIAGNSVYTPETEVVTSAEDAEDIHGKLIELGFEGSMLKRFNHPYREGRTSDWMKRKPEEEVDVEIIDWTPGKDAFEGLVGSLVGRAEDGSIVSFSGFPMALRQELTDNFEAYRGRWAEVRYMQRDSQGGYRHPRFYRWHPDK
ncbi:ATP-dependent DNA ligase [Escherichia phage vB_EcoP_LHP]